MSAIAYLQSLKGFVAKTEFNSENAIFRLHYQFTVVFLIGVSVLLNHAETFRSPIICISHLPQHVINSYCWISSTFTISDYFFRESGVQSAHPGVFSPDSYDERDIESKWRFYNYYQWVVFILCFMAFFCYLPKFIWNLSEGGLLKIIGMELQRGLHKEEDICYRKNQLVEYLLTHIRMHNSYVFKYWFCELLCLVNIVGQMFLVDKFLGGEFMKYGINVIEFSNLNQEERDDPMIFIFPRMTKCHFNLLGPSGTIQRYDSICLLPHNILNEKTFIVVWFWYVILFCLLSLLIFYRILLIVPGLRLRIIHLHNQTVPIEVFQAFTNKSSIGDWWILYILSKNIDPLIYRDIMTQLANKLETVARSNTTETATDVEGNEGLTFPEQYNKNLKNQSLSDLGKNVCINKCLLSN